MYKIHKIALCAYLITTGHLLATDEAPKVLDRFAGLVTAEDLVKPHGLKAVASRLRKILIDF